MFEEESNAFVINGVRQGATEKLTKFTEGTTVTISFIESYMVSFFSDSPGKLHEIQNQLPASAT